MYTIIKVKNIYIIKFHDSWRKLCKLLEKSKKN